ncbi:MAG: hypothetical protein WBZ36_15490 [Candidatus Nitrosopolaris sp.]
MPTCSLAGDIAVLRYDKRGVGANFIVDQNVWGNATVNDLIHDAGC